MPLPRFLFWACLVFPALALTAAPLSLRNGRFAVEVDQPAFSLRVLGADGRILLESGAGAAKVRFTRVTGQNQPSDGGSAEPWRSVSTVVDSRSAAGRLEVDLAEGPGRPASVRAAFGFTEQGDLRSEWVVLPAGGASGEGGINRLELRFRNRAEDRFYGMGQRFEGTEHQGKSLYNWAEEGCAFLCPGNGEPLATGAPIPYFYNPRRGLSFLLDDTHYSVFDFGKSDKNEIRITNWNYRLDFLLFAAENPLKMMEAYTAFAGRATFIPRPWAFGTWNTASGGSNKGKSPDGKSRTLDVMDKVRREGIPVSAIWNDDWDFNYFFGYEALVKQLHGKGFKALGYRWPYLFGFTGEANEGKEKGFLTLCGKDPCGGVPLTVQADLSTSEARDWAKKVLLEPYFKTGGDGFMHDFGEYTPAASKSRDGRSGWAMHNEYPRLWAQTGREFWDAKRPGGDWIFFMRSGYTGSWKYSPVHWVGDQNTDWGSDGIKAVVPAVTGAGLSGFPVVTGDIGGYLCATTAAADRELFYRWTQLGSLLPVMREHNGFYGCGSNFLFDTDAASLAHWKKYAVLHNRLFPYLYTLMHEAKEKGYPVVRHLLLHHPEAPGSAARQNDQFLVGDRLLVAPVVEKGATSRMVYLPPGAWIHFWSGTAYTAPAGGREVQVQAGLEEIPLFVKAGTVLPLFDLDPLHTLVAEEDPAINGFTDANRSLTVRVYGGQVNHALTLWDGTRISCVTGACRAEGGPSRKYTFETVSPQTVALGVPGLKDGDEGGRRRMGVDGGSGWNAEVRAWRIFDAGGRAAGLIPAPLRSLQEARSALRSRGLKPGLYRLEAAAGDGRKMDGRSAWDGAGGPESPGGAGRGRAGEKTAGRWMLLP